MGNFSAITGGCGRKIVYDSSIKKLKCEKCKITLERPPEMGICGKFNPNPIVPTGEFPPLRKERRIATKF